MENRTKMTHHPMVEQMIILYRSLNNKVDSFKFTPTDDYITIEFMSKNEDEWISVAGMSGSLELFAELTYPAPEGMCVAVDNNPDYTWLQLTDRGYKFFDKDIYAYDVKQFDEWFKTLNEEESCKNIIITHEWKKHLFRRIMRLQADDDPIILREIEAAPQQEHDALKDMPWNFMMECMLSCMRSDDELEKTRKTFYGEDYDIVRIFTLICIHFRKQLNSLPKTAGNAELELFQVAKTYYIDKIMTA